MPGFVPLLGPLLFFFPLALFAQRFMGLRETIQYGVWALFISNIAGYFFGGGGISFMYSVIFFMAFSGGSAFLLLGLFRLVLDLWGMKVRSQMMAALLFFGMLESAQVVSAWLFEVFFFDAYLMFPGFGGMESILTAMALVGCSAMFILKATPEAVKALPNWKLPEGTKVAPKFKNAPEMRFVMLVGILLVGDTFMGWGIFSSLGFLALIVGSWVTALGIYAWKHYRKDSLKVLRGIALMLVVSAGFYGLRDAVPEDLIYFSIYLTAIPIGGLVMGLLPLGMSALLKNPKLLPRPTMALYVIFLAVPILTIPLTLLLSGPVWLGIGSTWILMGVLPALLFAAAVPLAHAWFPRNRNVLASTGILGAYLLADSLSYYKEELFEVDINSGWMVSLALSWIGFSVLAVLYFRRRTQGLEA